MSSVSYLITSQFASNMVRERIWPDFVKHFKSDTTAASYRTDIQEFTELCRKDFLMAGEKDAEKYFQYLIQKVEERQLGAQTMAKKVRELHSFAAYIEENRESYNIPGSFRDYFKPYLKQVAKQEKLAGTIPVEHADALLRAAEEDLMAYTIFALLYRVSLSSTEIIELTGEDFMAYDNGVYVTVKGRREACFVPADAAAVVETYIRERQPKDRMFYNSRGKQLNVMYISRLMKKYTHLAGIPAYSAQELRNACAFTLFAYGAKKEHTARQMGITVTQIQRYCGKNYRENLMRKANTLVKLKVEPPKP